MLCIIDRVLNINVFIMFISKCLRTIIREWASNKFAVIFAQLAITKSDQASYASVK